MLKLTEEDCKLAWIHENIRMEDSTIDDDDDTDDSMDVTIVVLIDFFDFRRLLHHHPSIDGMAYCSSSSMMMDHQDEAFELYLDSFECCKNFKRLKNKFENQSKGFAKWLLAREQWKKDFSNNHYKAHECQLIPLEFMDDRECIEHFYIYSTPIKIDPYRNIANWMATIRNTSLLSFEEECRFWKGNKVGLLRAVSCKYLQILNFVSREDLLNFKDDLAKILHGWKCCPIQLSNDDYHIVERAVFYSGSNLQFASERLRSDMNIVMTAVTQDGLSLQYASSENRNVKWVVLKAVQQNGLAFQYASDSLKNDWDIISAALRNTIEVFQFIPTTSSSTHSYAKIMMLILSQNQNAKKQPSLKSISETTSRNNRRVVISHVITNGMNLEFASDQLKKDKIVVLTAIRENPLAYQFASEELKHEMEFKKQCIDIILSFSGPIRKRDVILRLFGNDRDALLYIFDCNESREIMKAELVSVARCVNNRYGTCSILKLLPEELRSDRQIVEACIRIEYCFEYASTLLKHDEEFILKNKDFIDLWDIPDELRNDRNFILKFMDSKRFSLSELSTDLQNDFEIVLNAVKRNGLFLTYASDALRNNREIVLQAIIQNPKSLKYASHELQNDHTLFGDCAKYGGVLYEKSLHKRTFMKWKQSRLEFEYHSCEIPSRFNMNEPIQLLDRQGLHREKFNVNTWHEYLFEDDGNSNQWKTIFMAE
ncbi:hypothetical protein FDP41_006711 [Naegleria fowleri]|uniref:DUF4116 domain-containing protein n=1 Tax=Naegleria fowleri TaxID=5763 RepID=A0A6A5BI26_NAEFO|nr:uncharacterized protein FDP41_006711 [Naegleria fowleri]KAF0974101.1 hypothetical protein FDP41_006711 [Naegleria fowleri]